MLSRRLPQAASLRESVSILSLTTGVTLFMDRSVILDLLARWGHEDVRPERGPREQRRMTLCCGARRCDGMQALRSGILLVDVG